jgi:hypothetical protein
MKRIAQGRKIMKKRLIASLTVSVMFLFTVPAYADSIVQLWSCKLNDDKTWADLTAVSSAWLKAAKSMEGGDDLEAYLEFPIAADAGDGDFTFVMVVADTKTWGVFNDDYPDSPAGQADEAWGEVASCSSSSLWASVEIE